MTPPKPGSSAAVEQGCLCKYIQGWHKLVPISQRWHLYVDINDSCPLHGLTETGIPISEQKS